MCGIAGFWDASHHYSPLDAGAALRFMCDSIKHRGPDAGAQWSDAECGIHLGHRRLSILDLSPAGAQPMVSHSGRFVMVYNGEIYNFPVLRQMLEAGGHGFTPRGHSDSEILLECFEALGIEKTLQAASGMFAIALWDRQERTLTLMRDPLGKKPLYAGFVGKSFVFASELKAFHAFGRDRLQLSKKAFGLYNAFGFVPENLSIYEGIYKIAPAHFVTLRAGEGAGAGITGKSQRYWQIEKAPPQKGEEPLEELLKRVVAERMVSDVPLGAFLSGGIDSSLVTALMQAQSAGKVKTYSIGFESGAFDESVHAEKVAAHLGTDHKTYMVREEQAREIVPLLPQIYDEPFADYSQIPTVLLCREARKDTVVALTGDGGDEVFCGYKRYFMLKKLWDKLGGLSAQKRKMLVGALLLPSQGTYNMLRLNGKRLHTVAHLLRADNFEEAALKVLSVDVGADIPAWDGYPALDDNLGDFEKLMMLDTHFYLPGDVLVKVDRASMFSSLELRSPLLDRRVVEAAWRIPVEDKIFEGQGHGKKPLYDLLCRYVPRELVDRPKQGFTPPIGAWLKGPLKGWAKDLLMADTGLYDPEHNAALWREFHRGRADTHYKLWTILMAQSWFLKFHGK